MCTAADNEKQEIAIQVSAITRHFMVTLIKYYLNIVERKNIELRLLHLKIRNYEWD